MRRPSLCLFRTRLQSCTHPDFSAYLTHSAPHLLGDRLPQHFSKGRMAGAMDLKFLLESSLNEIFKATVTDILDSVDRTLSDYQGTIRRIELENEDLRRQLLSVKGTETVARGMISYNKSPMNIKCPPVSLTMKQLRVVQRL